MKRFLQQTVDTVTPVVESELSMEDLAKMNIRNALIETALSLGAMISLNEQAAQEKKPEKPPIFSAPEHEQFYHALSVPETGSEKNPWIRTRGKDSTAYGPVQMTATTVKDYYTRYPNKFKGNEEYVEKFLQQGEKFKQQMHSKDPTYGRGGVGELGSEEYHEPYMRMADAVFGGMRSDMERIKKMQSGSFDVGVMTQRWRGVPREKDERYFTQVEAGMKPKDQQPKATPAPAPKAPAPAPKPTQAPVAQPPATPPAPSAQEYEIKKGDTLGAIAKRTGRSVEAIAKENKIADPNKISAGQKIRIPQG